jgi:Mg2+-importing ATPase
MLITPVTCAVIGAILPFRPLARFLGFATLPLTFFLILLGMIGTYLVLIEFAKSRFYRTENHPHRTRPTHDERHERRVARRAARFVPRDVHLSKSRPPWR